MPTKYRLAPGAKLPAKLAKERLLSLLEDGYSVADAAAAIRKSDKTFYYYTKSDPDFKRSVDLIRARQANQNPLDNADLDLDFESFRAKFLHSKTFPHQRNMIDLLMGRPPSWLHPSMTYEPKAPELMIVNIPPNHAKSMTVSVDYATWRICMDSNVRILIVSKTKELAKDFLYAIKQRLTHPQFVELQRAYAPPEGFEKAADTWSQDSILIHRSEAFEKDPTVQALGIGGQIYGSRADLIILDDCVTLSNVNEYEKQIRWLQQEVINRPQPGDRIMVLGTRVDAVDLYRELRNADRYPDGESPWTYLAMPAVLEFADRAEDWVTLWPKSDRPWKSKDHTADKDGLFPRWDGNHLKTMRGRLDPKTWAMVYQQQDVQSDSVFAPELVRAAVNGMRGCGPLIAGAPGYPATTDGFYTICSMDPAMSGDTFTIAYTGDRSTKRRYILEASRMQGPTPQRIRQIIREWTEKYRPAVWVIEQNAFQLFLTQDEEINQFLASKGIRLVQHYTGRNKMDAEFGVASMASLFGAAGHDGKPTGGQLIELPRTVDEGMKALVEQLIVWSPGMKGKQDGPMALWFAETQMRKYLDQMGVYQETWIKNPFATRYDLSQRRVVDLESFAEEQQRLSRQANFL
jgi:hypothetical protein